MRVGLPAIRETSSPTAYGRDAQPMSLQLSQTPAGITPARISRAKILHPTQNAKTALERRGDDHEGEQDVGTSLLVEAECEDRGGDRQRRADALSEALRRARDEPRGTAQPRRDQPGDDETERAQLRAREDARDEPVGDHDDQPVRARDERGGAQQHDAPCHQPGRSLVDRIREAEEPAGVSTQVGHPAGTYQPIWWSISARACPLPVTVRQTAGARRAAIASYIATHGNDAAGQASAAISGYSTAFGWATGIFIAGAVITALILPSGSPAKAGAELDVAFAH